MTRDRGPWSQLIWLVAGFWASLVTVDVVGDMYRATSRGRAPDLSQITFDAVVYWSTWIALTPLVLLIARWTLIERVGLSRTVVYRLLAGVLVAGLHVFAGAAVFTGIDPVTEGLLSRFSRFSGSFFLTDIPIVWSLFGLVALVEGAERVDRVRELEDDLDAVRQADAEPPDDADEGEGVHGEGGYAKRFMIRVADRIRWIKVEDVDYISADGNYMRLHVGDRHHLVRRTMTSMESVLDPDRFARIHRSTIVNVDRVAEVHPVVGGDYEVRLVGGERIRMSRTHKDGLLGRGV